LRDELYEKFDVLAHLVESSGGAFEIKLEDSLVFSKLKTERFPEDGEIVRLLQHDQYIDIWEQIGSGSIYEG